MNKNTIVLQQGRTASRWQYGFLRELGLKVFHEPIGGWPPNKFDTEQSWNHYLNTRMSCRPSNFAHDPVVVAKFGGMDLREVIENKEYIEVGYASLPFARNIPCDWRALGVVRHPQTWIYSAVTYRFFNDQISWKPATCEDYAKLWMEHNTLIKSVAERMYRMEDLSRYPEMFAQEFGVFHSVDNAADSYLDWRSDDAQVRHEKTVADDDGSWWSIVEELADHFGYEYMADYQLDKRTREDVAQEVGLEPDELGSYYKRDYDKDLGNGGGVRGNGKPKRKAVLI